MDFESFESYRRFDSRGEAVAGFDRIVGRTQRSLQLFDDSGDFWGLGRTAFADAAKALLGRHRAATITIIVHETAYLEQRCPRLVDLLRLHAPRIRVLRTEPSTRAYSRGFVIADATVVLRRPHFEQPRVFVDFNETEVGAAASLFAELAGSALPGISSGVTGL